VRVIAFDTETALIMPGLNIPPLACVSTAEVVNGRTVCELLDAADGVARIWALLRDSSAVLVGHNVFYDLLVIAEAAREEIDLLPLIFAAVDEGRVRDTMTREKLLDIADGWLRFTWDEEDEKKRRFKYTLASLNLRYRGFELAKDEWRLKYGTLIGTPLAEWPEGAKRYAAGDALATLEIHDAQETRNAHWSCPVPVGSKPLGNQVPQMRSALALRLMSAWGLRTDPESVDALERRTNERVAEIIGRLQEAKLVRADGSRDMKKLAAMITEAFDGNPPLTDKGNVKADKAVLQQLADMIDEEDHPLANYQEYRYLQTFSSNFLWHVKQGVVHPLNPSYDELIETGRTSSFDPNIQNQPARISGVRECFTARPGFVFCSVDYDGIELRTLAQVCIWLVGYSRLADAINAGKDPHVMLAATMLAVDLAMAEARHAKGNADKEFKTARQRAKVGNFGFPGGMGWKKFLKYARDQFGIVLTEEQSKKLKEDWLRTWPEVREYLRLISSMVPKDASTTVKQFVSDRIRGGVRYTDAANGFFQGLAADGAKAALWAVAKACYLDKKSPLYGCRPVAFVHDELIVEMPLAQAHAASHELSRIMVAEMKRFVPDVAVSASPALMLRWSKSAEACYVGKGDYDAAGREVAFEKTLVPWEHGAVIELARGLRKVVGTTPERKAA
jgi:DNA polymerase-1